MEILDIEKYIWRINYPLAVEIPVHPPNPTTTKSLMVAVSAVMTTKWDTVNCYYTG